MIDSDTNATWGSSAAAGVTYGHQVGAVGTASSSIAFYPAYPLTAGATKRIKVRADTTGSSTNADEAFTATNAAINGTQAQWYIDTDATAGQGAVLGNAICWGDGTTLCSAGGFNLEAKVIPVYGPAIRY